MDKIVVYRDEAGKLRWRFVRHGNHETMADGGESYESAEALEDALLIVFAPGTIGRTRGRLSYFVRRGGTLRIVWQDGR